MGIYKVKNTYHIAEFYKSLVQKHPLQFGHQFIIEFVVPEGQTGSGNNAFGRNDYKDMDCFTYWAQSSQVPKRSIKQQLVKWLANDFAVPTVVKYDQKWQTKILLDQDLTQYKKLQDWQKTISDFSKSGGGRKIIPNVIAKVSLLDNTMQYIQKTFVMQGVWISDLGNVQLQYSNGGSALTTCAASFTYQYFYPVDNPQSPTDSDPLSMAAVTKSISLL